MITIDKLMGKFKDKFDFIKENVKNQDVLDIGCVQSLSDFSQEKMKETQHFKLKQYTKKLIGVDLDERGVEMLNSLGCNCFVSFAENIKHLNLGKFDIILLGDIIEHIPDPCNFLINLRPILKEDGKILCTTPNALSYEYQIRLLLKKPITRHQHVAWYCRVTLRKLFLYSGYKEVHCYYGVYWKTTRNKLRPFVEKIIFKINQEYASQLLCIFQIDNTFSIDKKIRLQKKRLLL